ncbi:MAG: hypothetical protein GWN58_54590 [Anaerolineae bacterium]|nr:hypothetical protein [Anaerolineae bacterium]
MSDEQMKTATLEEWMEAALTMAEVNGMSDDTVIPTWPSDVVERSPGNHPELTVGALRQWQASQKAAALSQAQKDYNYDCDLSLLDMSIRDIESGFTVCPECSAEIDHQKHPFDCLAWLKQVRQQLVSGQTARRSEQGGETVAWQAVIDEIVPPLNEFREDGDEERFPVEWALAQDRKRIREELAKLAAPQPAVPEGLREKLFQGWSGCSNHGCIVTGPKSGIGTNGFCQCISNASRSELQMLQARLKTVLLDPANEPPEVE